MYLEATTRSGDSIYREINIYPDCPKGALKVKDANKVHRFTAIPRKVQVLLELNAKEDFTVGIHEKSCPITVSIWK